MAVADGALKFNVPAREPSEGQAPEVGWVRQLLPWLRPHRGKILLASSGAVAVSALAAVVPALERQIIDRSIVTHTGALVPWLVAIMLAAVGTFAATYVRRFTGSRVSLDVQYDLRNALFKHLQRLDLAAHDRLQTGQLVSRANSDLSLLQNFLSMFPMISGNILLMVLSLGFMFAFSPLLTIVSLLVLPGLVLAGYLMREQAFPAMWDAQQKEAEVAVVVEEAVTGVRVVKGFGQEERELSSLIERARILFGARLRSVRIQARYQPILSSIPTLGQVGVLAFGGWLAIHHRITIGTFLAFSTYLLQSSMPARMMAIALVFTQEARAGAERIFELLRVPATVTDSPDAGDMPPLRGEIVFDRVSFAYAGGEPVLRDLRLRIAPGEKVAVVGASGTGKSTLAMLLGRFYDVTEGAVTIDGTDVRRVRSDSLRRQIGMVFEESFLFSDTVAANIAYARPEATGREIEWAADLAQAHRFITELPDGYETQVGERGMTLSGGQRQRVALARAILADPRLLVLDDATSAIDARVEEEIYQGLRQVMEGRTTVLVAHRRSTLRLAERVVVLEDGRVLDDGAHDELLARCPTYRQLLDGFTQDEEASLDRESAVSADSSASGARAGGVTPSAWPEGSSDAPAAAQRAGGWHGWVSQPPTPKLRAKVQALVAAPVTDSPGVDIEAESTYDPSFRLFRFLRPYIPPLALGLLLVLIDAVAGLAGPMLIRDGLNSGVAAGSLHVLWVVSGIFLAITLADLVDEVVQTLVTGRTSERLLLALRVRIFAQLQRLSIDFYDKEQGGRIMTRMTTDVDALANLLQGGLLSAVVAIFTFFGVAVLLCVMNVKLALAVMAVIVPLVVATVIFQKLSRRVYTTARERVAALNGDFQEAISGVREAHAFVRQTRNEAAFTKLNDNYLAARLTSQRIVATYFPFVAFLSDTAVVIVLGVGYELVRHHDLTAGALVAFLLYLGMFFSPILQLSQTFDSYQQAAASMTQIRALMAIRPLVVPPDQPLDLMGVPGGVRGAIRLDHVRFSYPGVKQEALRGLDVDIQPGQTVAVVGETGAGKSTVAKLIARFYDPTSGSVLIDGHDLRLADLGSFRRRLGYVPQEPFLFSGTVRDNIAYGRPQASDGEVEEAARSVGAHDFVASLPYGYRQWVSERGHSLSAGQRQLIALARAQLVDPVILLLDEATSNLDLVAEAKVTRAMAAAARGRTTVLIAHRLQTARGADRILVVGDGQVLEDGSHDALVAHGGRYAVMWEAFRLGAGDGDFDVDPVTAR